MLQGSTNEDGIFRRLRDRLNSYPSSRCNSQPQCIDRVLSGGSHVFTKVRFKFYSPDYYQWYYTV
jgi:hypothetical protein